MNEVTYLTSQKNLPNKADSGNYVLENFRDIVNEFVRLYYYYYDNNINLIKNLCKDTIFITFDNLEFINFESFYNKFVNLYNIYKICHTNIKIICQPIDNDNILIKSNGTLILNENTNSAPENLQNFPGAILVFSEIICIKKINNIFFINNIILSLKSK